MGDRFGNFPEPTKGEAGQVADAHGSKPPLGIMHHDMWIEHRLYALVDAMKRYADHEREPFTKTDRLTPQIVKWAKEIVAITDYTP